MNKYLSVVFALDGLVILVICFRGLITRGALLLPVLWIKCFLTISVLATAIIITLEEGFIINSSTEGIALLWVTLFFLPSRGYLVTGIDKHLLRISVIHALRKLNISYERQQDLLIIPSLKAELFLGRFEGWGLILYLKPKSTHKFSGFEKIITPHMIKYFQESQVDKKYFNYILMLIFSLFLLVIGALPLLRNLIK